MREGRARDADDQLTEIEQAQRRVRRGQSTQIIDQIEKSRQRADVRRRRIKDLRDAEEEYDD